MTLIAMLIFLVVFIAIAYGAYWVITKFFPEPMRVVALGVVGVILLIILLMQFVPDAANLRIWK